MLNIQLHASDDVFFWKSYNIRSTQILNRQTQNERTPVWNPSFGRVCSFFSYLCLFCWICLDPYYIFRIGTPADSVDGKDKMFRSVQNIVQALSALIELHHEKTSPWVTQTSAQLRAIEGQCSSFRQGIRVCSIVTQYRLFLVEWRKFQKERSLLTVLNCGKTFAMVPYYVWDNWVTFPSLPPSIHPFIHPSIHACIRTCIHPSIDPSIDPSIHPSIH